MKNSPFSIHNLNPGLVTEVERAYEQNVEAGRVIDDKFSGTVAKDGLAGLLETELQSSRDRGNFVGAAGLETIKNIDSRQSLESAILDIHALFNEIGLNVPTANEITECGVDLAVLAERYESMKKNGLQPHWVLAPHLDYKDWHSLYASIAMNGSMPRSTQHSSRKSYGLDIDREILNLFDSLDTVPVPAPRVKSIEGAECDWTLRLIPGTKEPTSKNIHYDDPSYLDKPSLSEYLTMQARTLQYGQSSFDNSDNWTWIGTSFTKNGNRIGVRGTYDGYSGAVILKPLIANHRSPKVGMRVPVWR